MLDAAELRRASASDAGAVAQYLRTIDSDELDALLDAFADAERKKSGDADGEWRALVHVLLRTRTTRQRTATRVLQSLWRGHASEMEALRWVSEISLAYMASVAGDHADASDSASAVAAELRVVLQVTLQFVRDAMAAATKKALPQLLALVPVLLHLLAEATTRAGRGTRAGTGATAMEASAERCDMEPDASTSIVHEHVVQLLELPWDVRSVPYLLELLREHTMLVSRSGWTQLRQSIEQLIEPTAVSELPTDGINPLVRECLLLAASRSEAQEEAAAWVNVARLLIRRLPAHMRQESEFNVQMSLHQNPALANVICDVLLASTPTSDSAVPNPLTLDASDAVLLLHVIRASKPLLHHHLMGSALAVSANDRDSVFSKAQRLILSVLYPHLGVAANSAATPQDKHVRQAVTAILDFGGRQLHARVWKAQVLHELARVWSDATVTSACHGGSILGNADVGVIVVEVIFNTVPEIREEILQTLLESTRVTTQSKRTLEQLRRLVVGHKSLVVSYRQVFEDWLSTLAGLTQHSKLLEAGLAAVASLVASLKDFYNFSMVLLRKQLSSPHASDREVAVNVWCSWLESDLSLDALQEEEIVLAIKHAVQMTHNHGWMFQRLVRIFQARENQLPVDTERHQLQDTSLVEFHRIFVSALREFVEPATRVDDRSDSEQDNEDESEIETECALNLVPRRHQLRQFTLSTLDACYSQNSSVASALQLGARLESVVVGLLGVEHAMAMRESSKPSNLHLKDAHLGRDFLRWLCVFARHREEFFQWISSGGEQLRVGDSRFVWALAARASLGCAFCNLALRRQLEMHRFASVPNSPSVWELLESQMSIVRLWRKFSATTPMADTVLSQKDNQLDAKILQSAASTVSPFSSELLSGIMGILKGPVIDQAKPQANSGASLDGIVFLLDAYIFNLSVSKVHEEERDGFELHTLITLYTTIAMATFDPPPELGGDASAPATGVLFTTYGESLAAQYPKSMRHLVVPESSTALTVTLDARAAEEVLSRVCVALTRTVDAQSQGNQLSKLNQGLKMLLQAPSGNTLTSGEAMERVALRLLDDIKRVMNDDSYAKFRLAAVALVRKLVEVSTQVVASEGVDSDHDEASGQAMDVVADGAYDLLCDHVVHQPPLLRALLALSFPTKSRFMPQHDVGINRTAAVLAACGFSDDIPKADAQESDKKAGRNEVKEMKTNQSEDHAVRVRRRRLRQVHDEDDDDKDEEVDAKSDGHESVATGRIEDQTDADIVATASIPVPSVAERVQRQPRLTTRTSQSTALVVALSFLERTHSMMTQSLLESVKSKASSTVPAHPAAVAGLLSRAVRIQSLLASSVFASADGSWISVRTLSKLSSIVESAVKIGKHCCSASTSVRGRDDKIDRETLVQSFISSVAVTVRGRAWLAMLRDATTQAAAKSKLSATILKLDVFLLDVPTHVVSLMKADALSLESKRSLRVFISTVEADLALSTSMGLSSSTTRFDKKRSTSAAKSPVKRHLVGVVPIVHTKRRKRLRSRHAYIDSCLAEEDGDDAFADLEDFIA